MTHEGEVDENGISDARHVRVVTLRVRLRIWGPYHRFTGKTIGKIILPVKILVTILSQNNSEMWSVG